MTPGFIINTGQEEGLARKARRIEGKRLWLGTWYLDSRLQKVNMYTKNLSAMHSHLSFPGEGKLGRK